MTDQTNVFFQPVSLLQKNVILNHKAFDYLLKIICQKYPDNLQWFLHQYLHHQFLFISFYMINPVYIIIQHCVNIFHRQIRCLF